MEDKKLSEIIKLEQLPVITQQLDIISKEIEKRVKDALKLECNEETVKEVKKVRADFNKEFKSLEDRRKQVKSAIMEKYDAFDDVYKEKISDLYKRADETLKTKIDGVEEELKYEKECELREFANEHIKAYNLQDIISFEDIGLNITLSASLKSLKEEIVAFVEGVSKDIELIKLEEYSDEILLEYKKCRGNFAQCKLNVLERHKQLDELKKQREGQQQESAQEQKIVEAVDEIIAPVEVEEKETYEFKIIATKEQVKQLVEYMKSVGIEYE